MAARVGFPNGSPEAGGCALGGGAGNQLPVYHRLRSLGRTTIRSKARVVPLVR